MGGSPDVRRGAMQMIGDRDRRVCGGKTSFRMD